MDYRKARKKTKENAERSIVSPVRIDYVQRRKIILLVILIGVAIVLGVVVSQY